ncbi:MAG: hypothetical protein C4537_03430 [Acholeplasma sp.]|jgi:hypothetical protein|nr:MAG: hypothetical protein C4537_03430 [Acholeplasma sp.]
MQVIDWLLLQNPVVKRLTKIHLLGQKVPYQTEGYINDYLNLFDANKKMWGGGVYSPKWISTHYTMLELMTMEIDPKHPIYQEGLKTLLTYLWPNHGMYNKHVHLDMCVSAMVLNMSAYGEHQSPKIDEIIDYILDHPMPDGGWNCSWERKPKPHISSVHTTLSVIEAFHQVLKQGYTYRRDEVRDALYQGIEVLLERDLFKNKKTGDPIHPIMTKASYPARWKYDILRALECFASIHFPYDPRMKDALDLLKSQMKGPFMPKGTKISGLTHFNLEQGRYGAMNTLRMLKVLKTYEPNTYQTLIQKDITHEKT